MNLLLDDTLQAGADVNAKDARDGHAPLHYAAEKIFHQDCIDVLLGVSNVNVNEIDAYGRTALELAYLAYTENERKD